MYYDSILIRFVLPFLQKLKDLYYASTVAAIVQRTGNKGKELTAHSAIWNFVKRKDYLSRVWEHSLIFRVFSWVLNAPAAFFSKLYPRLSEYSKESYFVRIFTESYIFKLMRSVVTRYEITIGLSIAAIAVIPDKWWKNTYILALVGLLFLLYYIKIIVQKYEGFSLKSFDFALFAFAAAVVVAEVTGLDPKQSMRFFLFYLSCFLLVLLMSSAVRTGRALNRLVETLLIGISLTGIYGVYQWIVGVPTDPSLIDLGLNSGMSGRVFSTMQNPNNYAEILVLALPFFAAVIFNAQTVTRKVFFFVLALPTLLALLGTGSRSSWIGLLIAGFVFIFFKERRLIPVAILLGILSIPVVKIAAPSIYMRAMTLFNASNDTSIGYRGLIYKTVAPMFKDYWVTGVGLGTGTLEEPFMQVIRRYFLDTDQMWTYPPHTHNLFLQIWIEVGFIGIVSFLWFIVRMVKNCMINIFAGEDKQINHILMAGVAGVLGNLVIGFAEYNWFYARTMVFFWVNIGIVLAGLGILLRKKEGLQRKSNI